MTNRPMRTTLPIAPAVLMLGSEYAVLAENLGRLGGRVFMQGDALCLEIPTTHAASAATVIAAWSEGR